IVAIEPLAQLHGPVVDRRRTIHDDVLAPAGRGRVKDPRERQKPLVPEMPRRDRMGVASDPHGVGRVVHGHDGFGVKPPRGGPQGVLRGGGLVALAEGALVHKREVRVIKRVLQKPQARALPDFVELVDAPEPRVLGFRDIGQREQRVLEGHPGIAMVRLTAIGGHPRARRHRLGVGLRNTDAVAGPGVGPPAIGAHEEALGRATFRELGGAMAAAVRECGRPSASRNSTIFSFRSVNGRGPSWSWPTGTVAYQKRRSTGWCVTSMVPPSRTRARYTTGMRATTDARRASEGSI